MRLALEQAQAAEADGEVPIGAVVLQDKVVIARGYNQTRSSCDPTAHAEIVALRAAARALGNYRLNACHLVVTCEPCPMCLGALVHARIRALSFGCFEPKTGALASAHSGIAFAQRHKIDWRGGILAAECADLLQRFFARKRELT